MGPFWIRSQHPQLDIARALIEAGADVNAKNRFGCVPLTEAIMDEQVRVALGARDSGLGFKF